MPATSFASLAEAEVVTVELEHLDGTIVTRTLMVDSGFTGASGVLLSNHDMSLIHASAPFATTGGALVGQQSRGAIRIGVAGVLTPRRMFALFADLSTLSLPANVEGMVGLTFLRLFDQWGAQRHADGTWRFGLTIGNP